MKALTICQPFAQLIVTPFALLPEGEVQKRVENRTWYTAYRGPLVIHAGKSRQWLEPDEDRPGFEMCGMEIAKMPFGAIVGLCSLVECMSKAKILALPNDSPLAWAKTHRHTEGPICFVLDNIIRLPTPIPYTGAQGLFDIPADLIRQQMPADEYRQWFFNSPAAEGA